MLGIRWSWHSWKQTGEFIGEIKGSDWMRWKSERSQMKLLLTSPSIRLKLLANSWQNSIIATWFVPTLRFQSPVKEAPVLKASHSGNKIRISSHTDMKNITYSVSVGILSETNNLFSSYLLQTTLFFSHRGWETVSVDAGRPEQPCYTEDRGLAVVGHPQQQPGF